MNLIELLKVVFLGIVEGITEWLPISSTGHMILVDEFIHLDVSPEFLNMFLVVIQLGAIMAVVVLYFNRLWPFLVRDEVHMPQNSDGALGKLKDTALYVWYRYCDHDKFQLWFKIAFACLPAMVVGLLFDDFIEEHFNNALVVSLMLILYGIFFILIEKSSLSDHPRLRKLSRMNYRTALGIGLFQVLAVIPGTSRSGATILGGMLIGTSRVVATEFTFFLAIPVMFGASLLKVLKFILKVGFAFSFAEILYLVVGMVVAFGVSILSIRFLMNYIKKNDFTAFGIYRIVLGIIVLAYFIVTKQLF